LAELLQKFGSQTNEDLQELWSRIAFHIMISNTDDHLRNHGFLIDERGWRLSPAYDLNPNPESEGLKLNISEDDNSQSQELALSVAKHFRLKQTQSKKRYQEIKSAVSAWRDVAAEYGLSRSSIENMAPAFRLAQT
jgi:serine/threonine-protein kinase HipA